MRTKNFLLTICVMISISLIFIIFGQEKPESIQNIVSTTNEQIKNFKDNLRDAETKTLNADEKYLNLLGFSDKPRLFPKDIWRNTSLPVVVTYVQEAEESQAIGIIINIGKMLPNNTILIYNLGLDDQGYKLDALQRTGAIFFLESNYRLTQNVITTLYEERASLTGILAWPFNIRNPVSSLTHKKMFEYFHTDADNFLFLQMVKAEVLLVVNTLTIHKNVMLPWVQCALTQDCVIPIGAQSAGCKFDKRPQYRYSGCHTYDTSALNIVLGQLFKQNSSQYTYSGPVNVFNTVSLSLANVLLKQLELNSTTDLIRD